MTDFDLGEPAPDADENQKRMRNPILTSPQRRRRILSHLRQLNPTQALSRNRNLRPRIRATNSRIQPRRDRRFPYSEVKQSPLYAREETWTEFEDKLDMELTPNLRQEAIRDDELREIHDIVL